MLLTPKKIQKLLTELDPDRFYVENIRSLLGTNTRIANWICELAVKQGFFIKSYAVECKNDNCGRIIGSYSNISEIPLEISCQLCYEDGEAISTFETKDLNIIPYYKYRKSTQAFA